MVENMIITVGGRTSNDSSSAISVQNIVTLNGTVLSQDTWDSALYDVAAIATETDIFAFGGRAASGYLDQRRATQTLSFNNVSLRTHFLIAERTIFRNCVFENLVVDDSPLVTVTGSIWLCDF